jgi:osmoprotectant transport system permease protein
MSATMTDQDPEEQLGAEDGPGSRGSTSRRLAGYLPIPLLVGASWLALYLWLESRELGSIEDRILTFGNVRTAFVQHLEISLLATVIVLLLAIPTGIALTRPWARRIAPSVVALGNIGQGVPAVGTIVLAYIAVTRDGRNAAVLGLVIYGFLPVLRGTMVGLQQVSADVIKAASGLGMSKAGVLRQIELPLSVPVVLTGVRTTLVLTVSTAPLAAFIAGGTLGSFIVSGFTLNRPTVIATGIVLAAGLALLADWVGGVVEDVLRPKGI